MAKQIQFELNGKKVELPLEKGQTLLWALRTNFNLTGTKYGCGEGYCGACTVILDGEAVRSCGISMEDVAGKKITTIEGLAVNDKLHPVQQAFVCALHKQQRTLVVSSGKSLKIQINFT